MDELLADGPTPCQAPIAGKIAHGQGYTLVGQDGKLYPFG